MITIRRVDELCRYADAIPRFAHAPFQDISDFEFVPDLGDVCILSPK
jgi:hypothetical protein